MNRNDAIYLAFLSPIVCVDRQKMKQNCWLSRKFDFFTEIGAWYAKLKMVQVKYIQFSPRCRKPHVKGQFKYGLTCFCPLHLTSCLHDANDFRLYSQLSLPIWRLSAYTLWNLHHLCYGLVNIYLFTTVLIYPWKYYKTPMQYSIIFNAEIDHYSPVKTGNIFLFLFKTWIVGTHLSRHGEADLVSTHSFVLRKISQFFIWKSSFLKLWN